MALWRIALAMGLLCRILGPLMVLFPLLGDLFSLEGGVWGPFWTHQGPLWSSFKAFWHLFGSFSDSRMMFVSHSIHISIFLFYFSFYVAVCEETWSAELPGGSILML